MTVLSDGSQARKTGSDKEMVLARVMRKGLQTFTFAFIQKIDAGYIFPKTKN